MAEDVNKLLSGCKEITKSFREALSTAIDDNGNPLVKNGQPLLMADINRIKRYFRDIQNALGQFINSPQPTSVKELVHDVELDLSLLFFPEEVNFSDMSFTGFASYVGCLFKKGASFENVKFLSGANFSDTSFLGSKYDTVSFSNATFSKTAFFTKTQFLIRAKFRSSVFQEEAYFSGAKFICRDSIFPLKVDYRNSKFCMDAEFDEAHFEHKVGFVGAQFLHDTDFRKSVFLDEVSFDNAIFKAETTFKSASFFAAPTFHETELHQNTSFEDTQFKRCKTDDDYRAYRTLKQHMNKVHARLEEGGFFALEQRTRRNLDSKNWHTFSENWFNIIVSYFYDCFSEYGQNTMRPVLWFAGAIFVFILTYAWVDAVLLDDFAAKSSTMSNNVDGSPWLASLPSAMGLSLQNALKPWSFFEAKPLFSHNNGWIALFSFIQSFFSAALITLWLLAIRRRFQKGE